VTAWRSDTIRFARFLSEIQTIGLTPDQIQRLCASMGLEPADIEALFGRATEAFAFIVSADLADLSGNTHFTSASGVTVTIQVYDESTLALTLSTDERVLDAALDQQMAHKLSHALDAFVAWECTACGCGDHGHCTPWKGNGSGRQCACAMRQHAPRR